VTHLTAHPVLLVRKLLFGSDAFEEGAEMRVDRDHR
jgi:hypothetical protein